MVDFLVFLHFQWKELKLFDVKNWLTNHKKQTIFIVQTLFVCLLIFQQKLLQINFPPKPIDFLMSNYTIFLFQNCFDRKKTFIPIKSIEKREEKKN